MLSKRDGKSLLNCAEEVTNSRHLADVILKVSPWSRICLDHDLPLKLRLSFLTKVGFENSAESLIWVIKRMIRPKLNEEKSCFQANWIRDLCRQAACHLAKQCTGWMDDEGENGPWLTVSRLKAPARVDRRRSISPRYKNSRRFYGSWENSKHILVYRAPLKGSGQVWWIRGGKLRFAACCRLQNAIFWPLIHQTWPEPFSGTLYILDL